MHTAHSVCPLDCPDRCSLEVRVDGGRVASISGSRVNPITDGFICAKVRRYGERVYGPDRLLYPQRRAGRKGEGRFERITWDEAIETIATQFESARRAHGGEAILPFSYGGSNGLISQGTIDELVFRSLGASRLARTVCAAPTAAAAKAVYGGMPTSDFTDVAFARYVIIWGANPKHSNIHLMPYLKQAREAGARVALVDPRDTLGPAWVDRHLAIYPGADAAVALAMIGHLERIGAVDRAFLEAHARGADRLLERARGWTLERAARRARVEARDIAVIAEEYAAADPAMVRCGWGLERNRNSEAAVAAVLSLPAVAGKFGKPGGGYALSSSPSYATNDEFLAGRDEPQTRIINMNHLGRALLDETSPPIKVLFVFNANPVVTIPDQNRVLRGLRREDLFTVVYDQVMTDTALYADIVLPATTFLEHTEISTSYGNYSVQLGEPVIARQGEAKPNEEGFALLAKRFGIDMPAAPGEALLRRALMAIEGPLADGAPAGAGAARAGAAEARRADGKARLERLRRDRFLGFDFPGPRPVQFKTAFPRTGSGKIELWPEELGADPYAVQDDPGSQDYPLALISPSTDKTISSSLGEIDHEEARLEMHPDDASARGLRDGQEVRVHNPLGEVRVRMKSNAHLRPGVVYLPKGIWNRHTRSGNVGTALVPDSISAVSGGACFNDARVEVAALTH